MQTAYDIAEGHDREADTRVKRYMDRSSRAHVPRKL